MIAESKANKLPGPVSFVLERGVFVMMSRRSSQREGKQVRLFRKRFVIWLTPAGVARIAGAAAMILLVFWLLGRDVPVSRALATWAMPLSGQVIILDAGHGGIDGGAVSQEGHIEKDLNLAIALRLRDYLQQSGAIVYMTRDGDYDLASSGTKTTARRKTEDLKQRVQFIKDHKANLVISIHMNSIPSPRWFGAQTFYYPSNPNNVSLATLIQSELISSLENTKRVASTVDEVYLLKNLQDTPSALVEVGFLSNPSEAKKLADAEYQRRVAGAIYQGILRYGSGERVPGSPKTK